jgi:hypothetical protein
METLRIEGTNISPRVCFEPEKRTLEISGYSRPENARDYYAPLIHWIENFKDWVLSLVKVGDAIEPITFKFKFIYFNSSSAKFIYDIIMALNEMQKSDIPLKIYWYFDEDDDELREAGEELSEMSSVPFNYVEVNRD